MSNVIDLTGLKFGMLTVIKTAKTPKGIINKRKYWECICDCGKIKIVDGACLRSGSTKSCGCKKNYGIITEKPIWENDKNKANKKFKKSFGESSLNKLFYCYQQGAKKRNLNFNLTKEEFEKLTKQSCYYCGCNPYQIMYSRSGNGDYLYNGIDRINSSKGYEISNVVTCCGQCNVAKKDYSKEEFISWINKVYNHLLIK